ncbi:MAG: inositol monophosphatase family protein [Bacteroidota bacterium]
MDLSQLTATAIKAAQAAGAVIKRYMQEEVVVEKKQAGASYASQVVTVVDRECETAILSQLLASCQEFDLALLSEETEDDGSRFEKDFFWCVDPMDGTLAFINKRAGFSVSIALVAQDGTPHIGVVYDPSTDNLYYASKGNGAYKNGQAWAIQSVNEHLTYVTDRKLQDTPRLDEIKSILHQKAQHLGLQGIQEIDGAGAVLNAIRVLENGPACMFKLPKKTKGGGSIWDFAATACIYQELGLPATNFAGSKLALNKKGDSFMNHAGVYYASFAR